MSKFAYYEQGPNGYGGMHKTLGLLPSESAEHIRNVDERHCKIKRVRRADGSTGWWNVKIRLTNGDV